MRLHNPLIPGFNPDPSAVLVDGTYYLVTSTFEYLPGIPVYASTDFEDWTQIGNVITRPEQGQLENATTGLGVWAPTIRHRDGVFYVIVTIAGGRGCVVYTAESPEGPWSDGLVLGGVEGIDPDLSWDDDGTALVTYSGLVMKGEDIGKHSGIRQVDVDLATGETLAGPRDLWSGSGFKFPEAPHLYRRGDWWYLMIAEGGTERGHGVSVARSRDPRGPFEPGPANPILSARSTNRPIQNTGHGDLVETPDGRTLMVLLGVRPRGATQAFSALGRETFATEVRWEDGWPVAEPVHLDPREGDMEVEHRFSAELDPGWLAIRRPPASLADLRSEPGRLTLHGEGTDMTAARPVFLGRRQLHQTATVATTIDASKGTGGLAVRYDEQTVYSITVTGEGKGSIIVAEARVPGITQTWTASLPSGPVELRLESEPSAGFQPSELSTADFLDMMTSDFVSFIARSGDEEVRLARVDGRYLSAETAASFTGRVIGLFAVTGTVGFDGFRYSGSNR
ncbi:glycoside hydrolase family 43 protein [Naasia sp. SYSU D00948]|uniref:glycoside hydrolase family 43 protein n=1 Tax=Naasia sp. SYSU D00948 TaxID=2817379 RepID=UPI001B307578|nr:glycoside hydrolase family 43 protein [Naasia sp. SYSU D00948]